MRYSAFVVAVASTCFVSSNALAQQVNGLTISSKIDEYVLKPIVEPEVQSSPVPEITYVEPVQVLEPYVAPPIVRDAYAPPTLAVEPVPQQVYVNPDSTPEPLVIQEYVPTPVTEAPIVVEQPYVSPVSTTTPGEQAVAVQQPYVPHATTAGANVPAAPTIPAPPPSSLPPVDQIASATLVGDTPTGFVPLLGAAAPLIAGAAGVAGAAAVVAASGNSSSVNSQVQ